MRKHNRSFLLGCLLLVMGLGLCSCEGAGNIIPDPGNTAPSGDNPDATENEDPTKETGPGEEIPDGDEDGGDDGGATPTPEPDPVTYTIAFSEEEYEFEIDETLDLNGAVTCEASDGSTATYTLSVDNSIFVIDNHIVTATASGNANLTATCDQDKSVSASVNIAATDLPVSDPKSVYTYKLGCYDSSEGKYYYLTGKMSSNDAAITSDWDSAADFVVEEVSGGYTISTTISGVEYYVKYGGSGTSLTIASGTSNAFTWTHDTTHDAYVASAYSRYICKQKGYNYMRCYATSNLTNTSQYYTAHLYESGTTTVEPDDPGDTGGSGDKTYTQTFTLDSNRTLPSDISSYSTGGFATTTYSNYGFDIYKGVSASGYFVKILSEITNTNTASSLPGMLSNTTGFYNIAKFELTYKTSSNSYVQNKSEVPHLYYGNTNAYGYTYDLSTSSSNKTVTIDTEGTNIQFFCLSTSYYDVTISSLTIYYNSGTASLFTESSCGDGQYRIEPVRYTGSTLVANSTYVTVPIDVTYNANGTYTINKYKTLTYDTYDSAYSAKRTTNAYTDPVDVAAYYIAFGTYPCNYTTTSNYSTAYSVFGSSTRFYSYYTRTNGYATSVPYRSASYYELDIAMTSNYTKSSSSYSRGVGRLVCWTNGFTGYDTYPVVTYTDDHYHTFKEYYNDGTFGLNFNAEGKATRYVHGYPTTAKAS